MPRYINALPKHQFYIIVHHTKYMSSTMV